MIARWRRLLLLLPWRRRAAEQDMQDELQSLAELDDLADRRELGNLTLAAEDARAQWGVTWLDDIGNDVRHAVRGLRRHPGFTATVVTSLAIGIGASTALFTLIDAVSGRLLPVADPQRLVALAQQYETRTEQGFTYQQFQRLNEQLTGMTLAGYSHQQFAVSVTGGTELPVEGELVSGSYFPLLGIHAIRGRLLQPEDDRPGGGNPVAVISDAWWAERFARDPNIVGRVLRIGNTPFTIVGITPPGFFGVEVGTAPRVFVPLTTQPLVMTANENLIESPIQFLTWVRVLGAIDPPASSGQVRGQLDAIIRSQDWQPPDKNGRRPHTTGVLMNVSTGRSELGAKFSTTFMVLTVVVGIVLAIACANTANLALARAAVRRPEFALRLALGARPWRIIRQVTVESLVLAAAAGAGGVALSYVATRALVLFASAGQSAITLELTPDMRILAFATIVSTVAGLAFGLAPAIRASRASARDNPLQDIGTTRHRIGAPGPARIFLIVQVALSVTLLAGTGVFVASLRNLLRQADGIAAREQVLTVRVAPRGSDQRNTPGTSERLDRLYRGLQEEVSQMAGVKAVSMSSVSPLSPLTLGGPVDFNGAKVVVRIMMVYPSYFGALGLTITSGRDLDARDNDPAAPPVAVVNRAYVRRMLGGVDPIASGATIPAFTSRGPAGTIAPQPIAIVGVVADSPYPNLRQESEPVIYRTFLQTRTGRGQMVLHVRTHGDPSSVARQVRALVQNVDPTTPSFAVVSLADEVSATLIRERLMAMFATVFSGVVIVLIAVGLYGLTAFGVARRTPEIGLRLALGATGWDVYQLVIRHAAQVMAIGVVTGTLVSWAAMRLATSRLGDVLFGVRADDPAAFAAAAIALLLVAMAASLVPARRAMRIEPISALRKE